MTDYISREAATAYAPLPKKLREYQTGNLDDAWEDGYDFAISQIDAIPAADVRPVVRGKWSVQEIYKHEMSYGTTAYEPVYKCSACGNLMESYLRYDEQIMPEDADIPRYCPNCGADMREES